MSNGHFLFTLLSGCSIKSTYIPVQFNRQQHMFNCNKTVLNTCNNNIWTLCYFIYILSFTRVQLEFNSHLTGDPRSTEIADDNSPIKQYIFALSIIDVCNRPVSTLVFPGQLFSVVQPIVDGLVYIIWVTHQVYCGLKH